MSDARMKKNLFQIPVVGVCDTHPLVTEVLMDCDELYAASISSCDTLTSGRMRGDSVDVRAVPVVFIVECIREEATVH